MASISTRKGDDGTTGLLYGQRVEKDHPQIEAVGALDELNTSLGAAKTVLVGHSREAEVRVLLETVQRNLVALMGEIACAESDASRYAASSFIEVAAADIARLDEAVATLESRGLRFDGWATPGANPLSAALDVARTVCRRAERRLTALPRTGRHVRPELRQFINRLADLLWLLAREAEQ